MEIRPSRKLSVIGAMKDIQDYKIMESKADMAPTLVERAKLELDWDKQDRPDDLKLKKQSIKKGEQDIVAKERESLLNYYNDSASMAKWVLEGETEEEQRKRYDVAKRMIISSHEDHVTSAGPGGKPGDLMPEFDIEGIKTVASLAAEKARKLQAVDPTKDIVDMGTGEIVREGEPKPTKPDKPFISTDKSGKQYLITPQEDGPPKVEAVPGITGKPTPDKSSGTGAERERATLTAKLPQYQAEAKADPNKLYAQKAIRLDENAEPTVDAFGAPVVLPTFESVAGKRGAPKALMIMGEQWDDAQQLQALLRKPKVAEDLSREIKSGLLARIKGKTLNQLNKWMAEKGIAADSDTATAIRRMQRLASEERKEFMGVAVTELEVKSALAWMPDAGDSYDAMMNKINLMASEGEEHFRRYMDVYKDKANMAPYYKAWGLERFYKHPDGKWSEKEPIYKDAKGNAARYLGDGKWEKL
jgi:hypothetical protein